jgi:hypothetical protein
VRKSHSLSSGVTSNLSNIVESCTVHPPSLPNVHSHINMQHKPHTASLSAPPQSFSPFHQRMAPQAASSKCESLLYSHNTPTTLFPCCRSNATLFRSPLSSSHPASPHTTPTAIGDLPFARVAALFDTLRTTKNKDKLDAALNAFYMNVRREYGVQDMYLFFTVIFLVSTSQRRAHAASSSYAAGNVVYMHRHTPHFVLTPLLSTHNRRPASSSARHVPPSCCHHFPSR